MKLSLTRPFRNLELMRRLRNLVGPSRHRYFDDDFNWNTYTRDKYGPQVRRLEDQFTLRIDDRVYFDRQNNRLETGDAVLIPNSRTIYEIIGMLNAKSTLEIGCGGGDHLYNLKKLYPQMEVRGGDRSVEQLAFLKERNPEIAEHTFQQDITMPLSSKWPKADVVYTNAVIMHIKTAVSHMNALANMFNLAENHVVLMENFGCHPFVDDIKRLHEGGHLNWANVHFSMHRHEGKPFALVVSREPSGLEPLRDYFELPNALKKRYA